MLAQTTTIPAAAAPARQMVAQASTPAPPPPPAASTPASGEKLISLDFKDADVVNLLRILAAESGRNIVAGDDVKGRVSISLKNVTWEQALDTILEVRGLAKVERDGVIRIVSIEQLTKEKEALTRVEAAKRNAEIETRTKMAEAQLKETELATRKLAADAAAAEAQARGPLREEVIRLSYADPDEVALTLQGILGIPPEGVQVPGTPLVPGVPANPIVIPSGSGPLNPELRGLPQTNAPFPPLVQPAVVTQPGRAGQGHHGQGQQGDEQSSSFATTRPTSSGSRSSSASSSTCPLPQIKIEARMEILDRNSLEAIGVQWGGATAGNVGGNTLIGQGFQNTDPGRAGIAAAPRPEPGQPQSDPGLAAAGGRRHRPRHGRQPREPAVLAAAERVHHHPGGRHRLRHRRHQSSTSTWRSRPWPRSERPARWLTPRSSRSRTTRPPSRSVKKSRTPPSARRAPRSSSRKRS